MKLPKSRIVRISKILLSGGVPEERRGGDRVSEAFAETKQSIRNFIKKLRGTESHYSRLHTKRIYLSAELSVRKLHKMYNSSCGASQQLKSTYSMFYKIFVTEFNIGFQGPAADVCSYCTRLKHKIKNEKNDKEKVKAITEKRIHQLRSNAFYELLKMEHDNAITFCFDMQQVQPLPKTPVGEAFYLRQISYYTFCCVKTGKSLKPQFYTWTENQASRGCTEVASALLHYISNLEIGPETTTLRLFCDGCGGQNKNSHVIHTLLFWLQQSKSNIQRIELHFPVRGHSFLPADRVFGIVERKLRKVSTILVKEDYHAIYQEVGDINILGNNWKVFDVKELQKVYKKVEKINDYKRITLTKNEKKNITGIECFPNYKSNLGSNKQNLLKRGKNVAGFILPELQLTQKLNPKKLANVKTLLEAQFGANWQENHSLNWYKNLLPAQTTNIDENEDGQDEETEQTQDPEGCECLEEESTLHI